GAGLDPPDRLVVEVRRVGAEVRRTGQPGIGRGGACGVVVYRVGQGGHQIAPVPFLHGGRIGAGAASQRGSPVGEWDAHGGRHVAPTRIPGARAVRVVRAGRRCVVHRVLGGVAVVVRAGRTGAQAPYDRPVFPRHEAV